MAINDGGPAFPGYAMEDNGVEVTLTKLHPGMTLRDYLAAHAPNPPSPLLKGILAATAKEYPPGSDVDSVSRLLAYLMARWKYRFADEMLRARDADKKKAVTP